MRYLKYIWPLSCPVKSNGGGIVRAILYIVCFFVYRAFTMYLNPQAPFSPYYHALTVFILTYIAIGMGLIVFQIFSSRRRRRPSAQSSTRSPDSLAFSSPLSQTEGVDRTKRRSEESRSRSRSQYSPLVVIPPTVEKKATPEENKFRNSANDKGHRDNAVVVFRTGKTRRRSSSHTEHRS